jgi:hypothetical protein
VCSDGANQVFGGGGGFISHVVEVLFTDWMKHGDNFAVFNISVG